MKKILILFALLALTAGCASPRKFENHSAKKLHQPDFLPDKAKKNCFSKQFQEADSMFNEKYR